MTADANNVADELDASVDILGDATSMSTADWLQGLNDCVHCGFCLPACPTYQLTGLEAESPRGRIWLMRHSAEGAAMDESYVSHLDACLGCMACVSACPSGVEYGTLIETARERIDTAGARPFGERVLRVLLLNVLARPGRLRFMARLMWLLQRLGLRAMGHRLGIVRRLPRSLRALEALLPRTAPARRSAAHELSPEGDARQRVGLLSGCVQSVYFGDVNAAAARVLVAEGCAVAVSGGQCCGALDLHAGRNEQAQRLAQQTIKAFEDRELDVVAVTAAGCGAAMKDYGRLLAHEPQWAQRAAAFANKVRDITEVVAALEPRAARKPFAARVAYQDACHLSHAQGVRDEPRAVLQSIPGLELVELAEQGTCCGSAGLYNVLEADTAEALGRRKADVVSAAAPTIVATANPGCALQLTRHLGPGVRVLHPVQLLDVALGGATLAKE